MKTEQEISSDSIDAKIEKPKEEKEDVVYYDNLDDMKIKIREALEAKAEKFDIDIDILSEVFSRGISSYKDSSKVSQEQYAFARVNSFINQGSTYFTEDADLAENHSEKRFGLKTHNGVSKIAHTRNLHDNGNTKKGIKLTKDRKWVDNLWTKKKTTKKDIAKAVVKEETNIDSIDEEAKSSDMHSVVIPSFIDEYGHLQPAKTIMRKLGRRILKYGNDDKQQKTPSFNKDNDPKGIDDDKKN